MQYTVTRGEKGKVEIKVDVTKADFVSAYSDMLDALGKDAKISGFRPGKIPKDVVENNIGVNKILNETASFLISKNLSEIFKKEKIVPIGNPGIAVHTLLKDLPFSFTATVISKPIVKISNWKNIKIKKVKPTAVGDTAVDDSIKNIFDAWKKQSQESRVPSIRLRASKSQESEEEEGSDNKSGKFIYDARGEKIFIKDDKSDTKQVRSDTKDEIDDNFAKKIGARDLAHLKELVRKDLEQIVVDQIESRLETELFEEILKLADFAVPDILVDDELNRILVRITQNLEAQNKKLEDFLKDENTTLDGLKAKLRPQAEKNVKITLIMDEIGKGEKVEVTKEEVENAAKGVDETKLSTQQKDDLRNYLAVSIFQAKTLDLVKKAVTS